jgi:hypothetical protein
MESQQQIPTWFFNPPSGVQEAPVFVFYCEFSQKRGPRMNRAVRSFDRRLNDYPKLHYPEMYLLEGGYREFYKNFSDLCVPMGYMPMLGDPEKERKCKAMTKSKSWSSSSVCVGVGLSVRRRPSLANRGLFSDRC